MQRYEMIRECFDPCSNSAVRNTNIEEIETDHLDTYVQRFCAGKQVQCQKTELPDGSVVYEIISDGLRQKITFSED